MDLLSELYEESEDCMSGPIGQVTLIVARAMRNWTQTKLAKRSGVPQAYISMYESGERDIRKKDQRLSIEKALRMVGRITW